MKICVQGLWHLGSVTAACLASVGHDVVGFDENLSLIDSLQLGKAPIFEPGLDELIQSGLSKKNLSFSSTIDALAQAEILWITYDTPVDDEDHADTEYVFEKIKNSLSQLSKHTLIIISSQMPVGTAARLEQFATQHLKEKQLNFAVSPENLRLGNALSIFVKPDRIVMGVRTQADQMKIQQLLNPITERIEWMSVESAEMTKHALNAFLATSVTFANEIAAICELVGADAKEVERGLKTEIRIGPKAYLSPGGPFAGGTLARDVTFLENIAQEVKLTVPLLASIKKSNDEHKHWVKRKLLSHFGSLNNKDIALWGLTYKAGTNTLRRSLAIELCHWLIEENANVKVYDPVIQCLPDSLSSKVHLCDNAADAVKEVEALVIGTEWPVFKDSIQSLKTLEELLVLDANRFLQPHIDKKTVKYVAVGSPS